MHSRIENHLLLPLGAEMRSHQCMASVIQRIAQSNPSAHGIMTDCAVFPAQLPQNAMRLETHKDDHTGDWL